MVMELDCDDVGCASSSCFCDFVRCGFYQDLISCVDPFLGHDLYHDDGCCFPFLLRLCLACYCCWMDLHSHQHHPSCPYHPMRYRCCCCCRCCSCCCCCFLCDRDPASSGFRNSCCCRDCGCDSDFGFDCSEMTENDDRIREIRCGGCDDDSNGPDHEIDRDLWNDPAICRAICGFGDDHDRGLARSCGIGCALCRTDDDGSHGGSLGCCRRRLHHHHRTRHHDPADCCRGTLVTGCG
mmetsp:Transcript_21039/g.60034  ORF Transcript_21039/g.60034 Transcript_21039/m.60034 type:complete len:238 (+) Transcript_21039:375-1088(+)